MYKFLIKFLICGVIFLSLGILGKKNYVYKEKIYFELYEQHLSFSYFNRLYQHYLGGIFPFSSEKTKTVFEEKLTFNDSFPYYDGVSLNVLKDYLVPSQKSGVVVFVGEKEYYGKTIVVEGNDDIDIWYGNICNTSLKLYDYIEKGSYVGTVCDEKLYLVYSKDNMILNYKDYLS